MSMLPVVASTDSLVIRQHKELLEVFTGFESKNRYQISSPDGRATLYAAEQGRGALAFISRSFLNTMRPFHIKLVDGYRQPIMDLHRPWRWWLSRLEVFDGSGAPLGAIQQRFAIFAKHFAVLDPRGNQIAELHGPLLRPWTFRVLVGGQEVGQITKQWSGFLREAFTDADTFGVRFSHAMTPQLRALALAATFLIDILYFEHKGS